MNDLFLRACRRQSVERTPIWLMRQAGRCLPEYREVRSRVDFVTLCRTPDLAAEVTLQPVDRLGVDAAILFSDILTPAASLGFEIEFKPGPVLENPVRTADDVARIRPVDIEESVPYVFETIRILRRELDGRVPLIGFAGAPFTLAAYLVEGRGSKNFDQIKGMLFGDPATAHGLLDRIATMTENYLLAQIRAGAQAVQLFDTWAGLLDRKSFGEFGMRYVKRIIERVKPEGVPVIYFALNGAHLLSEIRECGADVIGADWRADLREMSEQLGGRFALQGNLDPCVLMSSPEVIAQRAKEVLAQARDLPGHVFNLGHGVLPNTPVENVEALVRTVQEESAR